MAGSRQGRRLRGGMRAASGGEALEQERDEREQWEAQHGWKYCPHGDKFWDCPHCSDEWHAGFENASGDDEED